MLCVVCYRSTSDIIFESPSNEIAIYISLKELQVGRVDLVNNSGVESFEVNYTMANGSRFNEVKYLQWNLDNSKSSNSKLSIIQSDFEVQSIQSTVITLSSGTPHLLTIHVLKFEIVYSTTS